TSVVLPWSTWAIMAMLRMSVRRVVDVDVDADSVDMCVQRGVAAVIVAALKCPSQGKPQAVVGELPIVA
ncbi:MAG: hypothetical protein JXM70_15765, partial [Pirellulales bacterium]|nr:hypothetical protein [Pirellulales bacterium]